MGVGDFRDHAKRLAGGASGLLGDGNQLLGDASQPLGDTSRREGKKERLAGAGNGDTRATVLALGGIIQT